MTDELIPTRVIVMQPDGGRVDALIDLKRDPGYDELRALILPHLGGGDLERVAVLYDGRACDMFVDDRGLIKDLPRNEAATEIYWEASRRRGDDLTGASHIAGTAILFDRQVWF